MLMELSIIPLGRGRSLSADIAELVKIIDRSGLDYRLTAAGSIIEGTWDELMDLARRRHETTRARTERVEQRTGRLAAALKSVEDKVGKPVRK